MSYYSTQSKDMEQISRDMVNEFNRAHSKLLIEQNSNGPSIIRESQMQPAQYVSHSSQDKPAKRSSSVGGYLHSSSSNPPNSHQSYQTLPQPHPEGQKRISNPVITQRVVSYHPLNLSSTVTAPSYPSAPRPVAVYQIGQSLPNYPSHFPPYYPTPSQPPMRVSRIVTQESRPPVPQRTERRERDSEPALGRAQLVGGATVGVLTHPGTAQATKVNIQVPNMPVLSSIQTSRSHRLPSNEETEGRRQKENKQVVVDAHKRIVLAAMENSRLNQKCQDYDQVFVEMKAKINALEVQLHDYERLANEYGRMKARSDAMQVRVQEALEERSEFLMELERLQEASRRVREVEKELEKEKEAGDDLQKKIVMLVSENERIQSITHENEDLMRELESVMKQKEEAENMNGEAKERVKLLEGMVRDFEGLQKENEEQKRKISMLLSENERLIGKGKDFEMLEVRVSSLSDENRNLKSGPQPRSIDNRSDINDLKEKISLLAAENERLTECLETAERKEVQNQRDTRQIDQTDYSHDDEVNRLRHEIELLVQDNVSLQHALDSNKYEYEQIIIDLDKKLQEMGSNYQDMSPLKRSFDALSGDREDLNHRLVDSQNEINSLKSKIKSMQTDIDNEVKTSQVLHTRCEAYERQVQELRSKISANERDERKEGTTNDQELLISEMKADIGKLIEENDQLKGEINDLDSILVQKDNHIEELSQIISTMDGEIRAAHDHIEEKDQEWKEAEQMKDEYKETLREAEDKVESLRRRIQELEGGTKPTNE